MSSCTTTLTKHYKITGWNGLNLLREPGEGDGSLWGPEQAIIFESEKAAYDMLDRYFTKRIAKVVRA